MNRLEKFVEHTKEEIRKLESKKSESFLEKFLNMLV